MNKSDLASLIDCSVGMLIDSIRYFHEFATVEDANTLMVSGDAQILFRAPFACKLTECILRTETLETTDSSDEEINVIKVASGTAASSGTEIITTVDPVSDMTAATDHTCTVLVAADVNHLAAGDMVAIRLTGTINEVTGVSAAMKFERLN